MTSLPNMEYPGKPTREKESVAFTSVLAAALLTLLKTVVGLATGSLGILSEAAHSALDFVAALITYISVRVSSKPADPEHPFGHGKVEHLSAFVEAGLLLITCIWIIFEAVRRLFFRQVDVEPSAWAFGVMLISITIDIFRSRALYRVARKYNSQALEADALHFSTDIYSSSVVILGLLLVLVAKQQHIGWLQHADPAAALVVAGIVVYISVRLGKRTVDALVDAAPAGAVDQIRTALAHLSGLVKPDRIRVRQSGHQLFVDLRVTFESETTFERAQSLMDLAESLVHEQFPDADVMIYAASKEPSASDLVEKTRYIAHRRNLRVHDVAAYEMTGHVKVDLDLEVDPNLTLEAAHDQATNLEREIKQKVPEVKEVTIHLEPLPREVEATDGSAASQTAIEKKLLEIAHKTPGVLDCHSIEARQAGKEVVVSLHCTLNPDLPVAQAHDITEKLKSRFRQAFPQIMKISIHAEPRARP